MEPPIPSGTRPRVAPPAGVEHQESARRQQKMIDVNVAPHPVGHQHLMGGLVGDSIQACEELLAPRAALICADRNIAAGPDQDDRDAYRDPIRIDVQIVHPSTAASAPREGAIWVKCRGSARSRASAGGISTGRPMIGSTMSLNLAGCAVATRIH